MVAPNYERDRLDREILALQSLTHANVVRLIEYTFSSKPGQQRHYIVEEFIEGQDLKDVLQAGHPWGRPTTWTYSANTARCETQVV
jgi:serine/threonine protein kinase